jgi:hypothetical protein
MDLEGSCRGPIVVLSQHLPRWTEENHEKPPSEWPVSPPIFEPSIFRMQAWGIDDTQAFSAYLQWVNALNHHITTHILHSSDFIMLF